MCHAVTVAAWQLGECTGKHVPSLALAVPICPSASSTFQAGRTSDLLQAKSQCELNAIVSMYDSKSDSENPMTKCVFVIHYSQS